MKKDKMIGKRIVASVLSLALVTGSLVFSGFSYAEDKQAGTSKGKAQTSSQIIDKVGKGEKDETVYVIAGSDGSPEKIIVSEWLKNTEKAAKLEDSSELKNIKNVKDNAKYVIDKDNMKVWTAEGKDVYYQGEIDKKLPVDISVSYTLDGKNVSAKELAGKSGRVTIKYSYKNNEARTVNVDGQSLTMYVPFSVVTGLVLDDKAFSNVEVTNGRVINDGKRNIVMGFALPGMKENLGDAANSLNLPETFEVTADVKNFSVETSISVVSSELFANVSSDKLSSLNGIKSQLDEFANSANKLADGSSQLYDGLGTLLEKAGEIKTGTLKLYRGAVSLNDGAKQFSEGTGELYKGTTELNEGLQALSSKSEQLNNGAAQIFDSLIAQANTELSARGLGAVSMTKDNYSSVLTSIIKNMDEGNVRAIATQKARQTVEAQVHQNEAQIAVVVTQKIKEQVLQNVLNASGISMTVEAYKNALASGTIPASVAQQIDNAVAAQMSSEQVQSTIQAKVNAEINNQIEQAMNSPAVVQGIEEAVAKAKTGVSSLAALKGQLDKYNQFYQGLRQYIEGVDKAAKGSKKINYGVGQLAEKSKELQAGAATLEAGIKALMAGGDKLVGGVSQLNDGAKTLSEGMNRFNKEGVQKIVELFNGRFGELSARLKAMSDMAKSYDNFAGKTEGTKSNVKFVYKTSSIGE
ncbi:X-X-X-Leu-X-X-Gly heptad repeats [[Eubacterium] infirmum]|nr:X-X-X-Leu-X-X-Gly heptad repeats [[Eubacterium] infirmum]